MTTTVDKVAASWAAGAKDPAVSALETHWAYEAAVDISGKTGNKEQLATSASLRAVHKTARDALQFYTAYDRQVTSGTKSADQFKAGSDYQNNFSGKTSWYVRDEGGFDRVKDVELYNVAAAGFGYDMIKKPKQTLTTRAGFSFRYEGYKSPLTTDVKSAGLDFGLCAPCCITLLTSPIFIPGIAGARSKRARSFSTAVRPSSASAWTASIRWRR